MIRLDDDGQAHLEGTIPVLIQQLLILNQFFAQVLEKETRGDLKSSEIIDYLFTMLKTVSVFDPIKGKFSEERKMQFLQEIQKERNTHMEKHDFIDYDSESIEENLKDILSPKEKKKKKKSKKSGFDSGDFFIDPRFQ